MRISDWSSDVCSSDLRTGGALLAEVTELRAISGFDDAVYRRLRPYVCALPNAALSPINLNALDDDDAVLLTMLTDGEITPEPAQRLLRARPAVGRIGLPAFWPTPPLSGPPRSRAVRPPA